MDSRKEVLGSKRKRSARIGDMMISILHNGESGSILFMLFYLKEGIQVLPNTDDHVLRTIKQGWFDDYEDNDRMTCY